MIIYHGSNQEIPQIKLSKTRKYKDFGQGLYLTTLQEQAERMARRTTRRAGGVPTVTIYEFDEEAAQGLHLKRFDEINMDWALFIINNRNREFKDHRSELSNYDNKYDIVFGAVADDDIATTFELYRDGIITAEMLTERLRYKKLSNQYSFHTEQAISLLKKIGVKTYG